MKKELNISYDHYESMEAMSAADRELTEAAIRIFTWVLPHACVADASYVEQTAKARFSLRVSAPSVRCYSSIRQIMPTTRLKLWP